MKEEPKRGLFLFCRKCDQVREHVRTAQSTLRCRTCRREVAEHADRRVRNAFGDKGRGF